MSTSTAPFFSSILNFPNSKKITNPNFTFITITKIESFPKKNKTHFLNPLPNNFPPSICRNSLTLDQENGVLDDEVKKAESKFGLKVKVKVPLKVYHVNKAPELELLGKIGVVKQYVGAHKGKRISANLPFKVEFTVDDVMGRDGKPVKFLAHLKEDEFEYVESDD